MIKEYRDTKTGVHYYKNSRGELIIRYNADGTPYTD